MTEPLKNKPQTEADRPIVPRTPFGERLLRIRKEIIASGEPLLSWREIEREVAERRGGADLQG
jgi:hypothetical protein